MKEFKFNDEAVQPHIEELVNLEIGRSIITEHQIREVQRILKVHDYNDLEELRAVRNSLVRILSDKAEEATSRTEEERYNSTLSGCVFVIDSRMWDLTGEL